MTNSPSAFYYTSQQTVDHYPPVNIHYYFTGLAIIVHINNTIMPHNRYPHGLLQTWGTTLPHSSPQWLRHAHKLNYTQICSQFTPMFSKVIYNLHITYYILQTQWLNLEMWVYYILGSSVVKLSWCEIVNTIIGWLAFSVLESPDGLTHTTQTTKSNISFLAADQKKTAPKAFHPSTINVFEHMNMLIECWCDNFATILIQLYIKITYHHITRNLFCI